MESFTINVYTESGEHRACGRISSIERRGNGWIRCRFAAIRKERFLVRVEDNMASACGCISLRRTRFRMTGFVVPWPSPLAPALNASSATGWRRYDQRPRRQDAHGAGPGHPPTRVTWKTAEILIEMLEAGGVRCIGDHFHECLATIIDCHCAIPELVESAIAAHELCCAVLENGEAPRRVYAALAAQLESVMRLAQVTRIAAETAAVQ